MIISYCKITQEDEGYTSQVISNMIFDNFEDALESKEGPDIRWIVGRAGQQQVLCSRHFITLRDQGQPPTVDGETQRWAQFYLEQMDDDNYFVRERAADALAHMGDEVIYWLWYSPGYWSYQVRGQVQGILQAYPLDQE